MKAWHFSENAYPYLPPADEYDLIRVDAAEPHLRPEEGRRALRPLHRRMADRRGRGRGDHAQRASPDRDLRRSRGAARAGALARLSKRARLLILGNPVANRRQPVRVAEEMAMIDVLSKGRLECGFVRGVPYEVSPANSNPVRMNERQWEAMDLIVKAWTSHDGPFSHEGRFFHHRMINIWPRPWQQPHPPIWVSTTTPGGALRVGTRGYVQATFLTGFNETPRDLRRLSQGLARRRPRPGRSGQPARLCRAGLCRAEREGGACRRREAPLVHHLEQGAAALLQSARLCAGRRAGEDAARRAGRPARRHPGERDRGEGDRRPASCSPARPTRSTGRSRPCTTMSAASGIC